MGLDNIQLPEIIIHDLYKNCLIEQQIVQSNTKELTGTVPFLGGNKKHITILVNDTENIYLSDELLNFLMGILTACKLSMEDIALVNLPKAPMLGYKIMEQELGSDKILLMGIHPSEIQLPLEFPQYQIQNFNNQVYLAAAPLKIILADKSEKLKLWNCLKKIFDIS